MVLVLAGRCAPCSQDDPDAVFAGRVFIDDNGKIEKVVAGSGGAPAGFSNAPIIDMGNSFVLPGFIDLHNHIAYNTLPLWAEPTREIPYENRNQWPGAPSYQASVSWPASTLAYAAPEAQLAYVQMRALAGGTTAIQGWPGSNKKIISILRNIDDGPDLAGTSNLIQTSVQNLKGTKLIAKAQAMNNGAGFIYHLCEGLQNSAVTKEFTDAFNAGCLKPNLIGIHCNAVTPSEWDRWAKDKAGAIVWSPFSNLWLYGATTDIATAQKRNVIVCLGSDWGPSGTKNVQGEIKVAKLHSQAAGLGLTDRQLVAMITSNPGDALARVWPSPVGRLVPGAFADITVLRASGSKPVWSQVVESTEADVALVVINGVPRYGASAPMQVVNQPTSTFTLAGQQRRLAMLDPFKTQASAWSLQDINQRLNAVIANPKQAIDQANARIRAYAGPIDAPEAPLLLRLDMPAGNKETALTKLKDLKKVSDKVKIPALSSLLHDAAFFADVKAMGFHNKLLNGLKGFYQ